MTSRERVLAALHHQASDQVPLDLGGTESSGLTAMAYNTLRRHLGLSAGNTQVFDVYQQVVKIEDDLRAMLKLDTIPLLLEPRKWKPFTLSDGSACQIPAGWNPLREGDDWVVRDANGHAMARMPGGGFYFEPIYAPLAEAQSVADLEQAAADIDAFDWPSFADESLDELEARARHLYETTGYAIVFNLQCHLLAAGQGLRGYETFMMDLLAEPAIAHALLDRLTEAYIRRCERLLTRLGRYVQVLLFNDDLGTQNGPMLSQDCYRRMILPYQKRLFGHVKRRWNIPILFHSCGAVSEFIPSLIEAGIDALNPVQVSAAGMDSAELKRRYGKDLTFWGGGCNTQAVLNRGIATQIEAEVQRRIGDLAARGGFVFTQVHNIQPDVPPQNVMAMIEAFHKYCRY